MTNVTLEDAGKYSCYVIATSEYQFVDDAGQEMRSDNSTLVEISRTEVFVRTRPGPVSQFTCRATTIIGKWGYAG